jgi:GNAT superfamily N-acetyltransferase
MTGVIAVIERLTEDRVEELCKAFPPHEGHEGYFQTCYEAQGRGELIVLVARVGDELLGYLKVMWASDDAWLRTHEIPEINDLKVAPARRRQGIASRLMDAAEAIIRERSPIAGIGVGLHPGYAAAQRMYALRGYVPNGEPLTYRNEPVVERQEVVLDDDFVMFLTKDLS